MLLKRLFDLVFSLLGLLVLSPVLFLMALLAAWDTNSNGFFMQQRVGQHGRLFKIFKLRSIHAKTHTISAFGEFLRKTKIDELPQLFNVLIGDMSFVGPRPDIPGYYDFLTGEKRKILELKPGLTSEASLKYYDEDALLAQHEDALRYNDTILFPDKVRMNLEYYYNRSFLGDLKIIAKTFFRQF
ncbi:Sugar transferase involved in LPS biosynthesis (colanic, teichoic acid) [Kaistella treverensis]|uniref:Sugar transferase involved in LPS biosynthesis (Colanic, teichoic acid) n=1 Tax=Kaistella treverensis TaxID=631455 RepID=A0A1I3NK36_9FLAO|nr:sugar transferase [Kaistella treverensis]SFJ09515.1 Sugar transferase involved in LPS biosynthesis (colanic, teichoic acid) [Kaistella treverensis]